MDQTNQNLPDMPVGEHAQATSKPVPRPQAKMHRKKYTRPAVLIGALKLLGYVCIVAALLLGGIGLATFGGAKRQGLQLLGAALGGGYLLSIALETLISGCLLLAAGCGLGIFSDIRSELARRG